MKQIGIGILGAGMVARYHQQAVVACADQGARLVAVGHPDPARDAQITQEFGAPRLDPAQLYAHPEIDIVCICTPSGQHAAQAIAAAQAGKHVLVEKPMALSLADADAMIAAAERAGVWLGVALQRRADPALQRLHAALAAGELGRLTLGLVSIPYHRPQRYYDQAAWRGTWAQDGGGVLMNQGIHLIDLLVWLMGDPVEIQASAATLLRAVEVEDTLAATLRFAGGALATVAATTTAEPGFPHRVEIYGSGGGVQIEGEHVQRWATPAGTQIEARTPQDAGSGGDPRGIAPVGHIRLLRDIIGAVREGHAPLVDGAEGRRSLAAVLAIYRAAGLLAG
ncbi:MAG TPA: Gfo/Idh/MocA family oxidoreductase [Roseiflexaceae bacterium]|nr:Gfo/Idh/MocA family oxidoreductase [Roseiflexaceae bacterium]